MWPTRGRHKKYRPAHDPDAGPASLSDGSSPAILVGLLRGGARIFVDLDIVANRVARCSLFSASPGAWTGVKACSVLLRGSWFAIAGATVILPKR